VSNFFSYIDTPNRRIQRVEQIGHNIDDKTVRAFGDEWQAFHAFSDADIERVGAQYFDIVSPDMLNETHTVLDLGCGSGRFMQYLLPRVQHIVGIDPSDAIFAADALLGKTTKVSLCQTDLSCVPYPDEHFDFVYCLGVLHHIPDTQQALCDATTKLKKGGWFLLYIYYNLDNRGAMYRAIFAVANWIRNRVSAMPKRAKHLACDILAIVLYMPLVLLCRLLKIIGVPLAIRERLPLQFYENQSFYIIRNDALDRFGTPLEQRFSRQQIAEMMQVAGLSDIRFSENAPFWHVVGKKE
jgi:SAM-dependent methyltransferase